MGRHVPQHHPIRRTYLVSRSPSPIASLKTGKPRQRHIANLGRIDTLIEADLDSLIEGLLEVTGCPSLAQSEASAGEQAPIFERAVKVGDIWAVMQIFPSPCAGPGHREDGRAALLPRRHGEAGARHGGQPAVGPPL